MLPLKLGNKKIKKIGLIGEAFTSVYYGDYSGTPEHNTTLLECITAEVGQKAKITWINEQVNDEIIPANYLVRSEKEAYDGILGFTGEYFINNNLTGEPDLIRQDLSLSLIPSKDKQLKNINNYQHVGNQH